MIIFALVPNSRRANWRRIYQNPTNSGPGNRNTDGTFNNRSVNTNIWSSSPSGTSAWKRNLNSSEARVNRNTNSKANGFSVRCLKNW